MSQILCWNVDYQTKDKPWSTVKCTDIKKVRAYLQKDSIILVSSDIWNEKPNREFLVISKLQYPDICLGVVGSKTRMVSSIYQIVSRENMETYIQACMRRHFQLTDNKKISKEAQDLIEQV